MTRSTIILTALAVAVLAGCSPATSNASRPAPHSRSTHPATSAASPAPPPAGGLPVDDPNAPMPAPNTCHAGTANGQPLPDPHCTPGAINPAVTPNTLDTTICQKGWTSTVRPPQSKTGPMKRASAASYGETGQAGEYDHLIPLEIGGGPDDPRNLWVEIGSIPNPKDTVENQLNHAVCGRLVPLSAVQQAIASNWTTALSAVGLTSAGGQICLVADLHRCTR